MYKKLYNFNNVTSNNDNIVFLKRLKKFLKKTKSECIHEFSEWTDFSEIKYEYYNEPFQCKQGYILVIYPKFKRICKKCGYTEISEDIQKKLIKKDF